MKQLKRGPSYGLKSLTRNYFFLYQKSSYLDDYYRIIVLMHIYSCYIMKKSHGNSFAYKWFFRETRKQTFVFKKKICILSLLCYVLLRKHSFLSELTEYCYTHRNFDVGQVTIHITKETVCDYSPFEKLINTTKLL